MRSERIEETTEANRVAADSVGTVRSWGRAELARGTRFAQSFTALVRLLTGAPGGSRNAILAQAAELVGEGLGADRIGIYLAPALQGPSPGPTPDLAHAGVGDVAGMTVGEAGRFILAVGWARRGLAAVAAGDVAAVMAGRPAGDVAGERAAVVDFAVRPDAARRLREGRSVWVAASPVPRRAPIPTRPAGSPGWSRIHSTLQLPCVGPVGLLALITVEGARLDARAATRVEEEAEAAAALVGGYLERIRLERELERLHAERLCTERLAALGRVASSAAHDLNNVLTAIVGYSDLLELELPARDGEGRAGGPSPAAATARGQQELDEIRVAAARGAALVETVLAFGRRREPSEAELDLADALLRIEGMLRRVAGTGIRVTLAREPGLPRVRVDRDRFERVVLNLVANARHAIEACPGRAGRIEIALTGIRSTRPDRRPARVRLAVTDDGCGMDADVKRRALEPYFTTRGAVGGTGLGLAGAADLVRETGGQVEIESAPGAGTSIRLEFPVGQQPAHASTPRSPVPSAPR